MEVCNLRCEILINNNISLKVLLNFVGNSWSLRNTKFTKIRRWDLLSTDFCGSKMKLLAARKISHIWNIFSEILVLFFED